MAATFTRLGLRTASPLLHTPFRSTGFLQSPLRRLSSTTTTATATSIPKGTTTTATNATRSLDWNTFLKLRKQKRRYNLAGSIICSMLTSTIGLNMLSTQEIDLAKMIWGLDPLMVLGMGLIACGATGWLIGPVAGTQAFKIANRRWMAEITRKEKEFFDHIKKNRANPSSQSLSNPVPDYYGEKIGSLSQYRQWLKDQKVYNRKKERFF